MALPAHSGRRPLFHFRNHFFTDGRTPWTSYQPVARRLRKHRTTQTQNKGIHTPDIHALSGIRTHDLPASEKAKTVHALDRAAPVTGKYIYIYIYIYTHTHTHTYFAHAWPTHHSSVTSYAIFLQSPVRPWTQDLVQGYRWVKWASEVTQVTDVCLSLVDPVHWSPSKLDSYIHT
jgi:hypothetical protein